VDTRHEVGISAFPSTPEAWSPARLRPELHVEFGSSLGLVIFQPCKLVAALAFVCMCVASYRLCWHLQRLSALLSSWLGLTVHVACLCCNQNRMSF